MELANEKRNLRFALSKGRYLLIKAHVLKPVDNSPPGLIAFRLKVWKLVKTAEVGGWLDVNLENEPDRFVEQVTKEYRLAGWEVSRCATAMYDHHGQAYCRSYLNMRPPRTAEKLVMALEQMKVLIPRRQREPERPRWHFW